MATDNEVRKAIGILKTFSSKITKRRSRIEETGMEDNRQRRRALEGECGNCVYLRIQTKFFEGRERVMLACLQDNSPIDLFRKTDLGQEAMCPDYKLR